MQIYGWKLLVLCHYTDKSCDHNHRDGEDIGFSFVTLPLLNPCLKGYVNLWVEARHGKSPYRHGWCPVV